MIRSILFTCLALQIQGCQYDKPVSQQAATNTAAISGTGIMQEAALPETSEIPDEHYITDATTNGGPDEEEANLKKETRLRFSNFSVVFLDFKGYEAEERDGKRYYFGQFGGGSDTKEAVLNDAEWENENYREALLVKKDTIQISEFLFDDRINNTLIQILPDNPQDRFKLDFCYLSTLHEVIDYRKYDQKTLEDLYKKAFQANEQTKYYPIPDSAQFFFRAMPHTPDMVEVTVKNGKVVPVKQPNTPAQLNWEQQQYEEELNRIKQRYQLRDTLVVIPGEYDITATLTKQKKLYNYGYNAFLFRIQRFSKNKLAETRYIVVNIAYGC